MERPQSRREELQQRAHKMPFITGGEEAILSESNILAILGDVESIQSKLPEHLRAQVSAIREAVIKDLEAAGGIGYYVVSEDILRSIINRSVQAGAGQAISDIGGELLHGEAMDEVIFGNVNPEVDGSSAA